MKLSKPCCPECGKPAIGTIENVVALSSFDDDPSEGPVEYDGCTDFAYSPDEQKTVKNEEGEQQVACNNAHRWFTKIEEKRS